MIIEGRTCYCYFRGKDGLGTCDDGCQWFVKDVFCPYWVKTDEEWEALKKTLPEYNVIAIKHKAGEQRGN